MKKLVKFISGCLGLVCEGTLPVVPFIISTLLVIYMSAWFAFTFILTIPLVFYLVIVICDLGCTDKFIEWTFGMEIE